MCEIPISVNKNILKFIIFKQAVLYKFVSFCGYSVGSKVRGLQPSRSQCIINTNVTISNFTEREIIATLRKGPSNFRLAFHVQVEFRH